MFAFVAIAVFAVWGWTTGLLLLRKRVCAPRISAAISKLLLCQLFSFLNLIQENLIVLIIVVKEVVD
jgi:hypothetical protein